MSDTPANTLVKVGGDIGFSVENLISSFDIFGADSGVTPVG